MTRHLVEYLPLPLRLKRPVRIVGAYCLITANARRGFLLLPVLAAMMFSLMSWTISGAMAQTRVGAVTRIQGEANATTSGQTRALAVSADVFLNDTIRTGADARLEIRLEDDTVLTLGADNKLTIDRFVYEPGGSQNRLQLFSGSAFRMVTGGVGFRNGGRVTVRTRAATLGVRGTDFWGGPIDGHGGVFLIDGAVLVTTTGGSVLLDAPGQGTNIAGAGAAPGAVTIWPQAKVDRAVATVTFR